MKSIVKLIKLKILLLLCILTCSFVQSEIFAQQRKKNSYQNPVFNYDFPDPNLVISKDGFIYAYSTQVKYTAKDMEGEHFIPILKSKNLVNWEYVGDAFAEIPSWKKPGGIWAPDVSLYKDKYLMYYSISTWGDENPGIGVALSGKASGPFIDQGKLFLSAEVGVDNSIDPVLFVDKGKPYLFWGSFNGIYGIPLSDDGLKTAGEKFQIGGKAYEGSYLYKRGNFYYYFGSTGTCCEGVKSTYQVKVSRSKYLRGPYTDQQGNSLLENGGTLLVEKNPDSTGFVGPGHNGDIITDKAGQTWIVYHAYDAKDAKKGRVMLLDKVEWKAGWPVIKNYQPSTSPQQGPVF